MLGRHIKLQFSQDDSGPIRGSLHSELAAVATSSDVPVSRATVAEGNSAQQDRRRRNFS